MLGHAVHHRAHAVLSDPEVQLRPSGRPRLQRVGICELHAVVAGEVRRAGNEAGQLVGGGVDALIEGVPRRQLGARLEVGEVVVPPGEAVTGMGRVPGGAVTAPGGEALLPGGALLRPAADLQAVELAHLVGDPERLVGRQAQDLLGGADLRLAEGGPVRLRGIGQVGRRPPDVAAQHQQVGLGVGAVGGEVQRLPDRRLQAVDVVGHLAQVAHTPPVGLEALDRVVAVGELGRPVDRDVVVVVDRQEPPQTEVPRQRGRLVGDALHDATVAGDDEGAVVAHLAAERRAHPAFGQGHAHRVGEPLAERAGGHFEPGRVVVLGMPRRPAAPLAELAQVLQGEVVAGQVEHRVLEDAGVPAGKDEAVTIRPLRVARVVVHDARPEHVRQRRQRHGSARVPRVRPFGRVHRETADHVDAQLDQPGVLHDLR